MSHVSMGRWTSGVALALLAAAGASVALWGRTGRPDPLRHAPVVITSPFLLGGAAVYAVAPHPAGGRRARRGHPLTRARLARARDGEPVHVQLTAYCLRGTTRRGRYVRDGIVAADPRIFPLSRYVEVFVEDRYYGRFLVDDTGLKIRGPILDVWMPTCEEAMRFGRRYGVAVLVPR